MKVVKLCTEEWRHQSQLTVWPRWQGPPTDRATKGTVCWCWRGVALFCHFLLISYMYMKGFVKAWEKIEQNQCASYIEHLPMILLKDFEHTDVKLLSLQLRGTKWTPHSNSDIASAPEGHILMSDFLNSRGGGNMHHFISGKEAYLKGKNCINDHHIY